MRGEEFIAIASLAFLLGYAVATVVYMLFAVIL